ncbi:hypothetical protein YC2023_032117 [Brassica napus]
MYFHKRSGRWCAEIWDPSLQRRRWLGTFPTPKMAAEVYDDAAANLVKKKAARSGTLTNGGEPSIHRKDDGPLQVFLLCLHHSTSTASVEPSCISLRNILHASFQKNLFKNCFNLAKLLSMFKVSGSLSLSRPCLHIKKGRPYCRYQYSTHGKNRPYMIFGDKTQRVEFRVLKMRSLCGWALYPRSKVVPEPDPKNPN